MRTTTSDTTMAEKAVRRRFLQASASIAALVIGAALAIPDGMPVVEQAEAAPAGINIVTVASSSQAADEGSTGEEGASSQATSGINSTASTGSKINITGSSTATAGTGTAAETSDRPAAGSTGSSSAGTIQGNDVDTSYIEPVGPSTELLAWADAQDCTACHAGMTGSASASGDEVPEGAGDDQAAAGEDVPADAAETPADLAVLHAPLGCVVCHADDALIEVHEQMDMSNGMPAKLSKTQIATANCLACHDASALVEATSTYAGLRDGNGTTVNPHGALFMADEHLIFSCTSCHEVHDASKPLAKASSDLCKGCHHANVYECYTCH